VFCKRISESLVYKNYKYYICISTDFSPHGKTQLRVSEDTLGGFGRNRDRTKEWFERALWWMHFMKRFDYASPGMRLCILAGFLVEEGSNKHPRSVEEEFLPALRKYFMPDTFETEEFGSPRISRCSITGKKDNL
jgi:hypothetical protein